MRHPEHDRLAREVASWYEQAHPEMGYTAEQREHAWYRTSSASPDWGSVTVASLVPSDVPAFLDDVAGFFGPSRTVSINIPDAHYDLATGDALQAAGWTDTQATVFLAFVGDGPVATVPDDIVIVDVDDAEGLDTWARTKLMGFDDSEDEPSSDRVDAEIRQRTAESHGGGRWLLARDGTEPTGICGLYDEPERFVFLLATRVPYRHRGIARALLEHVRDPTGVRVSIINAREGGRPEALYRSLGFSDVIHRRHEFRQP